MLTLLTVALLAGAPASTDDLWTQDYPAAQARAVAEGKDLLLDFTGSDWCSWCIRLHQEVFELEGFAPGWEQFVPVTVDFPSDESILPAGVKQQNEALRERLPVAGFPTIYLCDALGRPYGTTGYREGGPEPYLEHLASLRLVRELRDAAWAAATEVKQVARAERIDQGLDVLPRALLFPHYAPEVAEARRLDPEDSLGLKLKYNLLADPRMMVVARTELEAQVRQLASDKDWAQLVATMQAAAQRYRGLRELAQFAMLYKAVGQLEQQDLRAGLQTLRAALARDPRGALSGRLAKMIMVVGDELGEKDF